MAEDEGSGVLAALAVVGGVLLGAYLLTHTPCPVCGRMIRKGLAQCPHCNSHLNWS
jgi:hypothetical protein